MFQNGGCADRNISLFPDREVVNYCFKGNCLYIQAKDGLVNHPIRGVCRCIEANVRLVTSYFDGDCLYIQTKRGLCSYHIRGVSR